jgi:hypothetical protein
MKLVPPWQRYMQEGVGDRDLCGGRHAHWKGSRRPGHASAGESGGRLRDAICVRACRLHLRRRRTSVGTDARMETGGGRARWRLGSLGGALCRAVGRALPAARWNRTGRDRILPFLAGRWRLRQKPSYFR